MSKARVGQHAKAADRATAADNDILRLGMTAIEQRRPADAERMARERLARRPEHPAALQVLGLALMAQKRPLEALAPLALAASAGREPMGETWYALALRDVGRKAEALDWLRSAITRQPPFARAFHELGILLCALRRYDEAEAVLKRGMAAVPTAADLSVDLGGVYICRADPANAKIAFARSLAMVPGHLRALHGFGTALLFEGQFERAAERFRQVLARDPNHVRARLDLAHCLLELERFDEAVGLLRMIVKAAPYQQGRVLKLLVSSGRGRFWLQPSVAAIHLRPTATAATVHPHALEAQS